MDERDEGGRRVRGLSTATGQLVHDPAFPAWRALGLGRLADRLYHRHDRRPADHERTDAPEGDA